MALQVAAKFGSSDLVLTLIPRSIYQVSFLRTPVCSEQSGCHCLWQAWGSGVPHGGDNPIWEASGAKPLSGWGVLLSDFIFAERVKLLKMRVQGRRVWACLTCFSLPQRCPSLQSVALSVELQTAIKGRQRGSLTKAWNPGISFVFTLVYGHWHYSLTPWMGNKPPSQE